MALLDKLAATEKRVRQLKNELAQGGLKPDALRTMPLPSRGAEVPSFLSNKSESADDLMQVKGVGAVFNGRLQQSGIDSFAKLKALSAEKLADILQIRLGRAENILAEANNF